MITPAIQEGQIPELSYSVYIFQAGIRLVSVSGRPSLELAVGLRQISDSWPGVHYKRQSDYTPK